MQGFVKVSVLKLSAIFQEINNEEGKILNEKKIRPDKLYVSVMAALDSLLEAVDLEAA